MAIEYDSRDKKARITNLGETKPVTVIGGSTAKFVPNVNFSFECESGRERYYLNVNRPSVKVANEKEAFASDKLRISVGNETDIWHIDENGRLKWDIEFKEKPPTNVFEWELKHSEGLEFFYQPALTQQEIDNHVVRPDNVVGSYAVYCGKSGHYKDADGKTIANYTTGKLLHIYRPLCKDANGKEEWAELNIEKGILRVTIPQKYLDDAQYPVTLDPTFGTTGTGGTSEGYLNTRHYAAKASSAPASDGTISKMWLYCHRDDDTPTFNPAVYSAGATRPNSRLAAVNSGGTACPASAGWISTDISCAVTASTQYWLCFKTNTESYTIYHDTATAERTRGAASGDYPDTWTQDEDLLNNRISVYAEYETGGSNAPTWGMRLGMFSGISRGMK